MQKLHHGAQAPPTTVTDRMTVARHQWNQFWDQGEPATGAALSGLPPVTAEDITHILGKVNSRKALGVDHWHFRELVALPKAFLEGLAFFVQSGRTNGFMAAPIGHDHCGINAQGRRQN